MTITPFADDVTVKGKVIREGSAQVQLPAHIHFSAREPLPLPEAFDADPDTTGEFQIHLVRRRYRVACRDCNSLLLDGRAAPGGVIDVSSGPAERTLELHLSAATGAVIGRVAASGRAAQQARVEFLSLGSGSGWLAIADQNGDFVQYLPPGEYSVLATPTDPDLSRGDSQIARKASAEPPEWPRKEGDRLVTVVEREVTRLQLLPSR